MPSVHYPTEGTMPRPPDPVRRLPRPAHIHAHIGRLLRELRLARRLFQLVKAADLERQDTDRKAVRGA
jgi:hypothetical protein